MRILGGGDLKSKLALTVNHVTASATVAIEQAGGKVTLIVPKVLEADVKKRAKTAAKRAKSGKKKSGGDE